MSLLNDMFKDIDAQESKKSAIKGSPASNGNKSEKQSKSKLLLPVVAGIAVIYFLLVELDIFGLMPQKAEPQDIPKPVELNSKWLDKVSEIKSKNKEGSPAGSPTNAQETAQKVTKPGATSESEAVSEVNAEAATDDPANRLVEIAYKAMDAGELLEPENLSAFQLLNSARVLSPDSPVVEDAMASFEQKLWATFNTHLQLGEESSAQRLLRLSRQRQVKDELLDRMQAVLNKILEKGALATADKQGTKAESDAYKNANKSQLNINVSNLDTHYATQLAGKDFYKVKESALDWALKNLSRSPYTQIALADAYAKQFMFNELKTLQQQFSAKSPAGASYAKARLALAQNDMPTAIAALEEHNFNGAADVYRLRLLAASYQAEKSYEKAVQTYQVVTRLPQAISSDWLGLAVSYDALKTHSGAYSAYHKFLSMGHHDDRIISFARQRAAEISLMMNIGR